MRYTLRPVLYLSGIVCAGSALGAANYALCDELVLIQGRAYVQHQVSDTSRSAYQTLAQTFNGFGPAVHADIHPVHGDATADAIALLYSLLGGIFMGSYPAPIKAQAVLKAQVHPIIFQFYKSVWVFIMGWIFVLANVLRGSKPIFAFTWFAILSAGSWIPSGFCCVFAVTKLGVGMALTIATGVNSVLSFFTFWLVLGERMKRYGGANGFYLAPVYVACIVAGMVALISAPTACSSPQPGAEDDETRLKKYGDQGKPEAGTGMVDESLTAAMALSDKKGREDHLRFAAGLAAAMLAGFLSAVQFGVVNIGKRYAQRTNGCAGHVPSCPLEVQERFNNCGSWMASFGTGALAVNSLSVLGLWAMERRQGQPLSRFHWQALALPGNLAGFLWCVGNFFQLAAVVRGGSAVMMPANAAVTLVTSGLWGLIYYQEIKGLIRSALWMAAAAWTVIMIVLLSGEKSL